MVDKVKNNIKSTKKVLRKKSNVLPKRWVVKTLGEVLTIERGGSPRPIKKYLTNYTDCAN